MSEPWNHLEGFTTGPCVLGRCVHAADGTAYFEAESESDTAIVRLVSGGAAEAQLTLWQRISALSHPNLLRLREAGWLEWEGGPLAYAILERPDENLGDVLKDRALDAGEARPALLAAAEALAYIHERGWVHGEMGPWNIVAVGDSIKVPSDGLRPEDETFTPAGDVLALGLTACEMLTRRVPSFSGGKPQFAPADRAALAPIERFIRNCLADEGRWTAARAAAFLRNPRQPEDEPVRLVTVPAPAPAPVRAVEPTLTIEPARKEDTRVPPRPRSEFRLPKLVYGAAAAAVLATVLFFGARSGKNEAPPPAPVRPTAVETKRAPSAPARQAPPAAAGEATAAREAMQPAPPTGAWRVIAYTYNALKPAEKKAESINKKWPQFKAEVFAPERHRGPYLISLNGRMTRDQALRLQRAARAKGLPRDTYIQNYTHH